MRLINLRIKIKLYKLDCSDLTFESKNLKRRISFSMFPLFFDFFNAGNIQLFF